MNHKKIAVAGYFLVMMCWGCSPTQEVEITIDRLEQSLFTIPIDSVPEAIPKWQQHYGTLFELYNRGILAIGSSYDPQYPQRLVEFLTDPHIHAACRKVMEYYPVVTDLEKNLSAAFSEYHRHFPERTIPSVYTLISGFNQSMIVDEGILAISLDKYLGANEEFYARLEIPVYQRRLMDKPYIVPDCMKAIAYTDYPDTDTVNNVLSNILYEGKIAWFTRQMLPNAPDSLIFGYTTDQLKWCKNNTRQMWTYLVEKKMLYRTDYLMISKLVGPAPFTSLFTRESPGRATVWVGYQIIESYMKHTNLSLEELMDNNDWIGILNKAKFKP
ncbi:MAG: hypothetical protein LBU62_01305 [Bacteroidales bacterium]|jgi:hypothetical protein|nr:hypothetical protein [Bacteroidales bacterium]